MAPVTVTSATPTRSVALLLGFALSIVACDRGAASSEPSEATDATAKAAEPDAPYLDRRSAHETQLSAHTPSPAKGAPLTSAPPGAVTVTYTSGELGLQAWVGYPSRAGSKPALIYFHGDFAIGPDDFEAVRPFLDAGFLVMTPSLRGENGNPGDFELLWGEVDDARAAVEWVASQPGVDRNRIYAFGHSIGGGIAAMLSLYPELPLRATGSCGGIYVPETFGRWANSESNAELVRFDASDPRETTLRVLGPNLPWMVHPHLAYVGDDDKWFITNAEALQARAWEQGQPFEMIRVPGDHMGSLAPSLEAFLRLSSAPAWTPN